MEDYVDPAETELLKRARITRWIKAFATAIVLYSVYNLAGTGNYKNFSGMFKGLPAVVPMLYYIFTVFYGISGVYCGMKMLKFEAWARKVMVIFASVSVVSGFVLNSTIIGNFKALIFSPGSNIPPELTSAVYRYAVIFTAVTTIFEIAVVFFFTRPSVIEEFKE
jgi:hypothetical protein